MTAWYYGYTRRGRYSVYNMPQGVGKLGEDIACRYLESCGHKVYERNVGYKVGEIDIVSARSGTLHFVEVKAQRVDDIDLSGERYRPEEKVDRHKQRQIRNAVEIYTRSNHVAEWQVDVVVVFIEERTKRARVKYIENVIV